MDTILANQGANDGKLATRACFQDNMKLVFVNIMPELQRFDSTAYITQPPVPLAVLNGVTPKDIETALVDEQADRVQFEGDAFAFSVSTQNAKAVYSHADALRRAGKTVILGGIHVTVCPDEAASHADAIVTGEAELIWPTVCDDLLAGCVEERYAGSPTPPRSMSPIDYRFFGKRRYLTPASVFATRGCNRRCAFCVSSRYMGPYRTKPLDVLEREVDQLGLLHPGAFLQFTDDNLLASRRYAAGLLALMRQKHRRFVSMVTVDQFCDRALMDEMAASGCLGVAVGVESVADDNCSSLDKYQNLQQPLADAVRHAHACGMQTAALIMIGLPHDTPDRLATALQELRQLGCALYDIRILRFYPGAPLYRQMLASGEVAAGWWLEEQADATCNHLLPSCLSMTFAHRGVDAMDLQCTALKFMAELNRMDADAASRIIGIGTRGRAVRFATKMLFVRRRLAGQGRQLLAQLKPVTRPRGPCAGKPWANSARA